MSGRLVDRGALLGRGGEGDVYEIPDQPQLAAKIYHKLPPPDRIAKLEAMIAMRGERLVELAAWPIRLLRDNGGGAVRGFTMPKWTDHQTIHHLYSPKSRASSFPETDFRFLVHVGMNLARAFNQVHMSGCVIGDVNYGNVLVSPRGTVKLIDCDSYQVCGPTKQIFRCEVGEPTFIPPELQGFELRTIDRDTNHDAFGLAILIFHLLFQGRHPFSGRFRGPGDMGIERAIREHRFAYGRTGQAMLMEAPPYTLRLAEVTSEVAGLFERAFAPENSRGGRRPAAAEWSAGLERMGRNLTRCAVNPAHFYVENGSWSACPWCGIETSTGFILFRTKLVDLSTASGADLAKIWAAIEAIPPPKIDVLPSLQSRTMPPPSPEALVLKRQASLRKIGGVSLAVVTLVLAVNGAGLDVAVRWLIGLAGAFAALSCFRDINAQRRREYQDRERIASECYHALERQWKEEATIEVFDEKRRQFESTRNELRKLPQYHKNKLQELQANQRELQLRAYLRRFKIVDAIIDGIGVGRKSTLLSYSIETADDVSIISLDQVPGFGIALNGRLLKWRETLQAQFRFDPTKGLDQRAVSAITQDIQTRQARLEAHLRTGPATLAQVVAAIRHRQQDLTPRIEAAARDLRQAQADLQAVS